MTKNIYAIDRAKVQRSFFGVRTLAQPAKQSWHEAGHYYQGMELSAKVLGEQDGAARQNAQPERYIALGYLVSGSANPAQNDADAIAFYKDIMNGTREAAFLMQHPFGKLATLVVFRMVDLGGGVWQDNRISLATSIEYSSGKLRGATEFSGHVMDYEIFFVDPNKVFVSNAQLRFPSLESALSTDINSGGS